MKQFLLIIALLIAIPSTFALRFDKTFELTSADSSTTEKKRNPFKFSASSTIVSTHFWRALPSGTGPCIEPLLTVSKGGLSFSAWGCETINNSYREIDLYVQYRWKFLQVGLFDYYCPTPTNKDFTEFRKGKTVHLFEAQALFFGPKKFPFTLTTACFIGGWDYDSKGEQRYSTYFELSYPFKFKDFGLKLEVGATPYKSMYASKASLFNYGISVSKNIKITNKYSLPTSYKLIYNADKRNLYFVFGFTIK